MDGSHGDLGFKTFFQLLDYAGCIACGKVFEGGDWANLDIRIIRHRVRAASHPIDSLLD